MSHETFYRWLEDVTFSDAVTKAEAEAELRFLGQVAKHAATSPQAAQWWLERRRREEYGRRDAVELTGADGGPIETADVTAALDDHEKDVLAAILRDAIAEKTAL